jgi:hypothetical protein
LRIERGDAAPRVDVVVEEESQKLTSGTPQTKKERENARRRAEKIASGEQADKPRLRPIADRRLIKAVVVVTLRQRLGEPWAAIAQACLDRLPGQIRAQR